MYVIVGRWCAELGLYCGASQALVSELAALSDGRDLSTLSERLPWKFEAVGGSLARRDALAQEWRLIMVMCTARALICPLS